uniref:Glycoprotein hormone alpha 2 n=1 Tax=Timema bartmani TaxID=61472 RepID=A0A7R9EPN0_9NEOP|nr:unnamed protein product [Timema bartmani]
MKEVTMVSSCCRLHCYTLVVVVGVLLCFVTRSSARDAWDRPGCHKVGHTRKISIPDCVEFHITTNACRGYCESWSIPSAVETLRVNPHQAITSVGQCCNIMDTEDKYTHNCVEREWKTILENPLSTYDRDSNLISSPVYCESSDSDHVEVRVMCLDGTRDLVFKSAKSCSCYHCKKD